MHKNWTGDLVGLMHDHKITKIMLADELGYTREYVSMVLNGHRSPPNAKEQFTAAVNSIIRKKSNSISEN